MVTRRCYSCRCELELPAFARDASKGSGYKSICRACDRERSREYYRANRERKLAKAKARAATPDQPAAPAATTEGVT
jgi:hypothetical protein